METVTEKRCPRCRETLPRASFRDTKRGLFSYCRRCESEYRRSLRRQDPEKFRSRGRAYYAAHRETLLKWHRRYRVDHRDAVLATERKRTRAGLQDKRKALRKAFPLKHQAQDISKRAIHTGRLVAGPCEIGVDCLGEVQGHHDDYAKPLTVRWLCRRHHQQWHAEHGEGANAGNPRVPAKKRPRKVTDDDIRVMRGLRSRGVTAKVIAERFGVSLSLVYTLTRQ